METPIPFSGPLKTAYSKLVDLELCAYFTYENMEGFYARQAVDRGAFAEYFRQSKLAHRDRAKELMIMAREKGWPFRIKLDGLPAKNHSWGYARFAFVAPKKIEREILDATLLLSRRANQMRFPGIIKLTDEYLYDQNRALADINLNLARLTRCNTFDNETVFNDYLAYVISSSPPRHSVPAKDEEKDEKHQTNESGFHDEDNDEDEDEDQWTDIEDEDGDGD